MQTQIYPKKNPGQGASPRTHLFPHCGAGVYGPQVCVRVCVLVVRVSHASWVTEGVTQRCLSLAIRSLRTHSPQRRSIPPTSPGPLIQPTPPTSSNSGLQTPHSTGGWGGVGGEDCQLPGTTRQSCQQWRSVTVGMVCVCVIAGHRPLVPVFIPALHNDASSLM